MFQIETAVFPIYKFEMTIGSTTERVYPIYGNDLTKEYELESGQQFFREKLSGRLQFQSKDYDSIVEAAFDTKFSLTAYISHDAGTTWSVYWTGEFWKTDCEFDEDARTVTVTPSSADRYTALINSLDKEYNLIELAPEILKVRADKRPMIQVYIPGQSVISCFLSGMWWEEECDVVEEADEIEIGGQSYQKLTAYYYFTLNVKAREILTTGVSTIPDVFYGEAPANDTDTFTFGGDSFYFRSRMDSTTWYLEIIRSSNNTVMWRYTESNASPWTGDSYDLAPVSGSGASGTVTITWRDIPFYCRYITDVDEINGITLFDLHNDDLTFNLNYRKVYPYGRSSVIFVSSALSDTPTKWGLYQPGQYYQPPQVYPDPELFPISSQLWGRLSYWFAFYRFDEADELAGRKPFVIRHAYPLYSVLSVLLDQIDATVVTRNIAESDNTKYAYYINGTVWGSANTVYCELIPMVDGAEYEVEFTGSYGGYCVVTDSQPSSGQTVHFAPGYTAQINTTHGQIVTLRGVAGQYLYVRADSVSGGRTFPKVTETIRHGAYTHAGTTDYSEFFYGENPISEIEQTILIVPKSNLANAGYDQPAQQAKITLRNVLDMLRDCFRCYCFVDDNNRLRIEHISYFMKGGTYTGAPVVGIDLTDQRVRRTNKPYATGQNQFKFDKPAMAARYQFGWMDEVSQLFEGIPFDIVSGYVEPTNIEEIRVSKFTSDVDYILLNPNGVSKEGFVLLAAVYAGDTPSQTIEIPWESSQLYNNTRWYRLLSERVQTGDVIDFKISDYTNYDISLVILETKSYATGEIVYDTGWVAQDIHKVISAEESGYFCRITIRKKDNSTITIAEADALITQCTATRYETGEEGTYVLPYLDYYYHNTNHRLQNAYAAFNYLQVYYLYDMPAWNFTVDGIAKVARGIKKLKTQDVVFQLVDEPDLNKLIKTGLGNGKIDKLSINLSSRKVNATLKYDTEQQP